MVMTNLFSEFFLLIAIVSIIISTTGVALMPTIFSKLHFLSFASAIGISSIALSILIREGFNQAGIKSIIAAVMLIILNPVFTHATARAKRIRMYGRWQKDIENNKR
jgi:monovalent cation/proton antiporter MnhG/PhaG subunit